MTTTVSALKARRNLGELLNRVSLTDEEIIIERAGKRLARLSGINGSPKSKQGHSDIRKARGLGKSLWHSVDVENYLQKERSEWD